MDRRGDGLESLVVHLINECDLTSISLWSALRHKDINHNVNPVHMPWIYNNMHTTAFQKQV